MYNLLQKEKNIIYVGYFCNKYYTISALLLRLACKEENYVFFVNNIIPTQKKALSDRKIVFSTDSAFSLIILFLLRVVPHIRFPAVHRKARTLV